MARNTLESWLPEEKDSSVIVRLNQTSALEGGASTPKPMNSDTKSFPRSAGMGVEVVPKGSAYGEDESLNDEIVLKTRKFGKALRIAEEDIDDSVADVIATKKTDWTTSYAVMIDNAGIGTTGAENGTTVPFTSVYRALGVANANTGYVANANVLKTSTAAGLGGLKYELISDLASLVEEGGFHDSSKAVFVAHPSVKGRLRKIKDGNGEYIFTANPRLGDPDTLLGYRIIWSNGAKTSATASAAPTGNPLIGFWNTDFIYLGIRSGPESFASDGNSGVSMLTDEAILKMRARRGFGVAHEKAAAILEILPSTPAV